MMPPRARGGHVPHLTGGAGGGEARLEKAKAAEGHTLKEGESVSGPSMENKGHTGNSENKKNGGK